MTIMQKIFTIAIEKMSIKQNKYAKSWKPFSSSLCRLSYPGRPAGPVSGKACVF